MLLINTMSEHLTEWQNIYFTIEQNLICNLCTSYSEHLDYNIFQASSFFGKMQCSLCSEGGNVTFIPISRHSRMGVFSDTDAYCIHNVDNGM